MAKPPFNPEPQYFVEEAGGQELIGIICADYVVRTTQVFHLQDLYRLIYHWMIEHEYKDMEGGSFGSARPEIFFMQRKTEKHGREHYIWWRWQKGIENSGYYRRLMRININTKSIKDVEMVSHDKKGKFQDGEIWVYVTSILEIDYNKEWRKHWLMKHVQEWFWKKLFWKDFDRHRVRTYREAYELERAIKEYFGTFQYHKERVPWRPPHGKQDVELASP